LICPNHRSKNLAQNVEKLVARGQHLTTKVPRRLTRQRGFLYLSPPGSATLAQRPGFGSRSLARADAGATFGWSRIEMDLN
jgi:hypothetical protein